MELRSGGQDPPEESAKDQVLWPVSVLTSSPLRKIAACLEQVAAVAGRREAVAQHDMCVSQVPYRNSAYFGAEFALT